MCINRTTRVVLGSVGFVLFAPGLSSAQPPSGGFGGFDPGEFAKRRFESDDRDRDGRLSYDEASDRTKANFKSIDKNGDGFLDLEEYKGYVTEMMQSRFRGGPPGSPPAAGSTSSPSSTEGSRSGSSGYSRPDYSSYRGSDTSDRNSSSRGRDEKKPESRASEVPKPIAIRYGKLPDELPEWFVELDIDRDGQIGLYEWRKGDRKTDEFLAVDANDDGLLTADEWLRSEKRAEAQKKIDELLAIAGGAAAPPGEGSSEKSDKKSSKSSSRDNPFSRRR